jgi:SAM-dependent methyltransferase
MNNNKKPGNVTFIDPIYSKGQYFEKSTSGPDASYKVKQLSDLILSNKDRIKMKIASVADVGCGLGKTTFLLQEAVRSITSSPPIVDGYDVHPRVQEFSGNDSVRFFMGDFCAISEIVYDLVVLFDVIEHVPDPVHFIKEVSDHARLLAFHIPLDNSYISWLRDLPRENLNHPGHLLVLDPPAAFNLLTLSGLRILDYDYSPVFRAPSGKMTLFQKMLNPFRAVLFRISPFLTQKLLAGVSLTVLAWTDMGLSGENSE